MIDSFRGEYRFLSNFWEYPIVYESIVYPTTEHAYQAAKSNDALIKIDISLAKTPGIAKKIGNTIIMRSDWNSIKIKVMGDITRLKYNGDNDLSKMLINTSPHELVEGNIWGDTFWGVCKGVGCNHLGKILMMRRSQLMGHEL